MGNSSSQADPNDVFQVEPFRPEVEVIRTYKINAHYGEHKLVRDKNNHQEYIQKEILLNNKQAFDKEVSNIKNKINLKHDSIINVLGYKTERKSDFCTTHYQITLYIEQLSRTLEAEIVNRKKYSQYYSEKELMVIAIRLINGLAFFQQNQFSHSDIRPSNIFINPETKSVKISDPFLTDSKGFNCILAHIIKKEKTFLALELLVWVPVENLEFKGNAYKDDVYSLGMTLLALATL